MKHWFKQNFIGIDQLINTFFFGGFADETISARAWREEVFHGHGKWTWVRGTLDALFFWEINHCKNAWDSEMQRRQMPVEYRK